MKEVSTAIEFKIINPATEEVINRYEIITKDQIKDKVKNLKMHSGAEKRWKLKLGDPLSDGTDIGPFVNSDGLKKIDSVKESAEVHTGGEQIGGRMGYFISLRYLRMSHQRCI